MSAKKQSIDVVIYQTRSGAIEFKGDLRLETIWANLQQIADLFETDKSGISRHINNVYRSKELGRKATVAKIATVQTEGDRQVKRNIEFYNLDLILSVGYRVNSKKATAFRQWATETLRSHIVEGFTVNRERLSKNYDVFIQAVDEVKKLLPGGGTVRAGDALELTKMFAATWLSLSAYDRADLPKKGVTRKMVRFTAGQLQEALAGLKAELIGKGAATELFGLERAADGVGGIVGSVFQAFSGEALYATAEEKAAHLLYFMVKNHPFVDGNKRSGAFAFVWFLSRAKLLDASRLSPEALTALTLLVAESKPKEKERVIGLVLLLLRGRP